MERDTIPPTPASTEQLLRELLTAVHDTRDDLMRVYSGLAQKVDQLSTVVDSLAGTVSDMGVTQVGQDVRLGRIEDQLRGYVNDLLAVSARVAALESARSGLTPIVEEALREIVPAVRSIARSLDPAGGNHVR